jgi:type II secretory pathway pseudopilin PulG
MEVRMHMVTHSVRRGAPVVVLAAAAIALSACGSGSSQSDLARARQAGASEQAQKAAQSSMAAELQKLKAQASAKAATPVPAPASTPPTVVVPAPAPVPVPVPAPNVGASCGGNLSVGANTSCAFGESVVSEYYYEGGGTRTITAYSPVTSTYYSMYCVGGVPTVCTGGNNATVYIR